MTKPITRRIKLDYPKISEIALRRNSFAWRYEIDLLLYDVRVDGSIRRKSYTILNITPEDGLTLQYIYMSNVLNLDVDENVDRGYPSRRLVMDKIDML